MPTFTSSYYLGISTIPWPVSRRQYFAFACLPSRPNGLLLLWLTTSFAAAGAFLRSCRGTAGLLPLLLGTQCHATRFAHSLAVHHFSWLSSHRLLLATKWFGFSDVSKSWKILLPFLVEFFRTYHQHGTTTNFGIERIHTGHRSALFCESWPIPVSVQAIGKERRRDQAWWFHGPSQDQSRRRHRGGVGVSSICEGLKVGRPVVGVGVSRSMGTFHTSLIISVTRKYVRFSRTDR